MKKALRFLKVSTSFFFFLTLYFSSFLVQASYVRGHLDDPGTDYENFKIRGWACQTGRNESIEVRVLLDGKSGTGTLYKALQANQSSAQGVANACSNSYYKNRFSYIMPLADVYKNRGKPIYAHGISTIGSGNSLLNNSGNYRVPNIPSTIVKGYIDALIKSGSDYYVKGWACQSNYKTPIDVHVYLGGKAGSGGSKVVSDKANLATGVGVANACKTTAKTYGFNIKIPASKVEEFAGKAIYVHGISLVGTPNSSIGQSGKFILPKTSTGAITQFGYDARGRLIEVADHTGQSVSYEYDDAGNRIRVNN
ncbi:RHS repeat domain-containing protein [Alteromonas sp. 14N.309.X.WAT.G.H12]|uniref:RHS repeat domain-containing protein n=1 Tax=Alteromonas sp. 14N.309.X.WAT.G.H12 TaxID=3120824 RepID=UPI002FD262A0